MDEVELAVAGSHLHATWHPARRSRLVAVLVHGFNSRSQEFGTLPQRLAEAGIHALALDLRGHGRSGGEAGRLDLDRALQDIEAAVAWIHEHVKRPRVALIGHSLGGALALGVAARRDHFEALVVAHPVHRLMDEVPLWQKPLYHLIGRQARRRMARGRAAGHFPRDPRYPRAFVDQAAARRAKEERLFQSKVNLGNYTFATTMDAGDWAKKVRLPTLCISSPHDRYVDPAASQRVFAAMAGPTEHLVHEGGHSLFLDKDHERVIDGIIDFLQRRLGT